MLLTYAQDASGLSAFSAVRAFRQRRHRQAERRVRVRRADGHGRDLRDDPASPQWWRAETGTAELSAGDQSFDLLLTDIDLPGQNGAELASSLRARYPKLAIVLMSGYPDDGTINEAGLNEEAVLRKPFSTAHLIGKIRDALSASPRAAG